MLRLFSALMMMLGMVALAGCQSHTVQPVEPVQVNEAMCCKTDGTCDKVCHQECKEKHVVCPKKAKHHHRHHHHKTTVTTETTQTTTQSTAQPAVQDSQTAAPAAQ